jgi:hypothetical protein
VIRSVVFALVLGTAGLCAEDTPETETESVETTAGESQLALDSSEPSESVTSAGNSAVSAGKGPETVAGSGALALAYPIEVPPGTNGVGPALSLVYSSSGPNGMLGVGWQINGLPTISRDTSYPVNFAADDHYLYEGQRLVYSDPASGGDGYYHTERETFVRIEGLTLGTTSSSWIATAKNGARMYFGGTSDSRIDAVGKGGQPRLWALAKVEDVHGNYYVVHYREDGSTGAYYPTEIVYTMNDTSPLTQTRVVSFSYEPRGDHGPLSVPTLVDTAYRLKWIVVKVGGDASGVGGDVLRKYRIDYEHSVASGRSLIVAIQQFGSGGGPTATGRGPVSLTRGRIGQPTPSSPTRNGGRSM